jgi:hypothetical protein
MYCSISLASIYFIWNLLIWRTKHTVEFNNNCSKLSPQVAMHFSAYIDSDRVADSELSGHLWLHSVTAKIWPSGAAWGSAVVLYTAVFLWPWRLESSGVRFGAWGGFARGLPWPNQWSGKHSCDLALTCPVKCGSAHHVESTFDCLPLNGMSPSKPGSSFHSKN